MSLVSCSNKGLNKNNESYRNELNSQEDSEILEMNDKITDSIVKQVKEQFNSGAAKFTTKTIAGTDTDSARLVIENDTEYVITESSFYFILKDDKQNDNTAALFLDTSFLEPGKKYYGTLMADFVFDGISEIEDDTKLDTSVGTPFGLKKEEYVVLEANPSNITFVKNDKGEISNINCTIQNKTKESYSNGLLFVEYKDKDGVYCNNTITLRIEQFSAGKMYSVSMLVREPIEDTDNIKFKIRFHD